VLYRSNSDLHQKTQYPTSCSTDAQSQIERAEQMWWLRGLDLFRVEFVRVSSLCWRSFYVASVASTALRFVSCLYSG
jgi:hypothetical protein